MLSSSPNFSSMEKTILETDIIDWLALNLVPGLGAKGMRVLLERFLTPQNIFNAAKTDLYLCGLNSDVVDHIKSKVSREKAKEHYKALVSQNIDVIALNDTNYPTLLKEIHDPPPVLYVRSDEPEILHKPAIAIVGSRQCSHYGRTIAEKLSGELASQGFTIISGLARGIDTIAHAAALDAGGKTIAVLGSGLDIIYPRENRKLAKGIEAQGALCSELPLGTPPLPQHFPFRNRIISGLCLGVVIVEAAERSGSLITARMAMEQNREVFAVPGNITSPNSFGPNYLIKDGAKLVQTWQDIVEELPRAITSPSAKTNNQQKELFPPMGLSQKEQKVYDLMDFAEPCHIDDLAEASQLASQELLSTLFNLEVKAAIKQLPGKNFVKQF